MAAQGSRGLLRAGLRADAAPAAAGLAPEAPGGVRVRHAAAVSSVPPELVLVAAAATIAALPGFTFGRCWFASAATAMFRP
jgi:hypothetical protein